jgi:protein-S-isoprenylcysteine O-methyltransferase Ste14
MDSDPVRRRATDAETPGVIGRPILFFLAAIPLGLALDHLLPLPRPIPGSGPVHWISAGIAVVMILVGVAIFIAGIRNLSRAGTAVPTNQPASRLVTTGVHGWTRNPIYLAFILACFGAGILIRSPWILILALTLAIYLRYGVVAREEAYLERRFGDAFRDYRARVRRWL